MGWSFRDGRVAPVRLDAGRGEVAVREIWIRALGSIRLPEDFELTSRDGAGQTRCQEAVIVVGIDPDRALRGVVAVICRGAPDRSDIRGTGSADGARQQHDANIGGLPIDGNVAVSPVARLPPRDKGAVLRSLDAL